MLYVCVRDVMMLCFMFVLAMCMGNETCEYFVIQMLYVCVLCASCGTSKCGVLHDLQVLNAGIGCKRRPYGIGILQIRSHDCHIGSHECHLLFTLSCCGECFY